MRLVAILLTNLVWAASIAAGRVRPGFVEFVAKLVDKFG